MYEFVDGMREISGFGGKYEATCRAMLKGGLEWLDAHPEADPQFHGFKNVIGLAEEDNADAEALTAAIVAPSNGDCTGAMHHACVSHCLFIRENGWDEYVKQMSQSQDA